jgi:hypothetical protein
MPPKLPRKSPKHQVLAAEPVPTTAASSVSSIPESIPADHCNEAIRLFRDFEYCHEKIFTVKSAILEELNAVRGHPFSPPSCSDPPPSTSVAPTYVIPQQH